MESGRERERERSQMDGQTAAIHYLQILVDQSGRTEGDDVQSATAAAAVAVAVVVV